MALPPHLAELESRLLSRFEEAFDGYRRELAERLHAAVARLEAELGEQPAPALHGLVADLGFEAVDETPRREGANDALAALLEAARAADRSGDQSAVLDTLLSACRRWSDRAALVLTRDDGVTLWGTSGFGEHPPGSDEIAWSDPLRAALVRAGCERLEPAAATPVAEALGFAARGSAVTIPMILRDRLAAVLWAEREASPPELPALQLLVHLTAQRLELQALSGRSATPSLYEVGEPGLEPPPLWTSTAAPVEETASTGETPAVEGGIAAAAAQEIPVPPAEIEIAAPEPEPELAAASAPAEATAPAAPFETDAELEASALEFEEIREEPPSGAATVVAPPAAPDYEPSPEFELEEMAPEPLEESLPSPAPPIDALGTVRLARPELLAPLREEQTAPLPIPPPVAAEPPPPAPEASTGAPAAPPEEADLTEDATVLTLRRPEWATPPAPPMPPTPSVTPPPTEEPLERTASRTRTTEVAPPPDVRGPGLAFAGARGPRSSEQPLHEEAKRLARLLISEIKLYNEEQVMEGRRNRDLYHRLRDDIDRSRQIYDERVDAAVRGESDYFQQELVRSLAGGDPRALGI